MPIQVSFSTDNLTPEEARWIASLVQPRKVGASEFLGAPFGGTETPGAILEVNNGEPEIVLPPVALAEETVEVAAIPETDSTGLPWDERIHASSKALNADGTWRTKRGVDKALVASVEAALRATHTITEQDVGGTAAIVATPEDEVAPVVVPPAPPAPEAPTAPLAPAVTVTEPAMSTEQTGNGSAPAPVALSNAVSPFVALMKRVTTAQGAGKLTQPRVKELLESLDKKSIMDLRTDEDALASFAVLLDGEGV